MFKNNTHIYSIVSCLLLISACKHEPITINTSAYPDHISNIILNKCATAGCHNNKSYKGAGGLNLTSWDQMFSGGYNGSVVIPYRSDFSTLCFYTNTDTNLGVTLIPTMPVNAPALSTKEYTDLKNWIDEGAPNKNGVIKFSNNSARDKTYVINQLCDVVTVFDNKSKLQMRYIDVGTTPEIEFPYLVQVSPDKKNWYVSFFSQKSFIQKFDAEKDQLVKNIDIGSGQWTSYTITADSKHGYFINNDATGSIAYVDLENEKLIKTFRFNDSLKYPKGISTSRYLDKIYVGTSLGNYLYSIDISGVQPKLKYITIDNSNVIKNSSSINVYDLLEHENKCYVSCTGSKDLRIINMQTDNLEKVISLNSPPAFMDISNNNKLFLSCPDDETSFPNNRGSVLVINTKSDEIIKRLNTGYQPYGIAIDEKNGLVAVVNANISKKGPEPHHTSNCGGRNGYVTFIDLNSLEVIEKVRSEVANYPISASSR